MIINDNDVTSKINLILANIPDNFTDIEKLRWVYLKLGQVFCYDYSILTADKDHQPVSFDKGVFHKINRYQTCRQISEILAIIINNSGINAHAQVITRELPGVNYAQNHVATAVFLGSGEKYILDLTLDLYLIQSGCQTEDFAFTTDAYSTYDILPLADIQVIDQRIGLLPGEIYTNQKNETYKKNFETIEFPFDDPVIKLQVKLALISKNMIPPFMGAHEGKRFIDKILFETLSGVEYAKMKAYNLFFEDVNYLYLVTCYVFHFADEDICYLYDNRVGFILTTPQKLKNMRDTGWRTNSGSFDEALYDMNDKQKHRS